MTSYNFLYNLLRTYVLSEKLWISFLCNFMHLYRIVVHTNMKKIYVLFLNIFILFFRNTKKKLSIEFNIHKLSPSVNMVLQVRRRY